MSAPDYPAAAQALIELTRGHGEQHRCTDGTYYGPAQFNGCPINGHGTVLLEALNAARQQVHNACHDDAAMYAVAESMSGIALTAVPCEVDAEVRLGWLTMARVGSEALAAHLDGVPS